MTYIKPKINLTFKGSKIDPILFNEYETVLDKFGKVKGILERYNTTELPFTYLFDAFTPFLKSYNKKNKVDEPFTSFEPNELENYFQIFLDEYLTQEDIDWRLNKY